LKIPIKTESGLNYSWLPLDNAAKIYPAVQSQEHTTVFRISAVLLERVKIKCLLDAIGKIEPRFEYFKVCLRKGFFWYYLEHVDRPLLPVADNCIPCRAFKDSAGDSPFLFRIVAVNNRISVEFSHIITDGKGASIFFTALLKAYFRECDPPTVNMPPDFQLNSPISAEEIEDAYNHYFKSDIPPVIHYSKAFHLPYKPGERPRFKVLVARLSLNEIKLKAREKEVSITDYLIAIYLFVLQEIHDELPLFGRLGKRKILRIQVPVNLRKIYPTKSMRNFSLFVLPEIDLRLGHYTFDEIIKIVHHRMKLETDEKLINKIISRNVGSEKNILVRCMPLLLKNVILFYKFYSQGANQYSGVMTNLGQMELPAEMMKKIGYFAFIPPPPNKKLKINCGVIGFKDNLVISFGNITDSNELQKKFFRFLTGAGIPVKLITY
jgi:NRPS condensation-like uncharacterized protein